MRRLLLPVLGLLFAVAGCGSAGGTRQVTLVLDFTPNPAHSGIYEAAAGDSHGIHLTIRQPTASSDSLKLLAAGRADIAIADIHDLGLARERGEDLVGIGALVQRPLAAVIGAPSVSRPRDLEGTRVGVTGVPSDNAVLRSVVQGDGGNPARVKEVTIGFNAVASLLAHKVAAATAFWNVEGVTLAARGFKPREFRVDDYGAPRYPELVLVARRDEITGSRPMLRDALAAIADGTRTALSHRADAVNRIAQASAADRSLVRAELDAIAPALSPPVRLQPAALRGWAAFDVRFGILKRPPDLARAFDTSLAP